MRKLMHRLARWLRERQAHGVEGYRWGKPRLWLPSLLGLHWRGLKNIIRWAPVIYRDADFDYDYLLAVLEYKLRRMANYHKTNGISSDHERIARQLSTAVLLCHRLREDDYFRMAGYETATWSDLLHTQRVQRIGKEAQLQRQDTAMLGRLLAKHLVSWWD